MEQETTDKIIGEFKPKRKFLNFISALKGAKVRLISDIAFLKGEEISGMLEGVIFKVTICDEGTINFEEVDTNITDKAQIKRLIDDISDMEVGGYAQKFIVSGLKFADKDGNLCYLEVEHVKPIDKLRQLFEQPKVEISEKGMSLLDELLGNVSDDEENQEVESINEVEVSTEETKETQVTNSYLEESFKKMNDGKIAELKNRIEDKFKEIQNEKRNLSQAESKMKQAQEQLGILETRLETMSPYDDPNGYVFFVSEIQKHGIELDEKTKEVAVKISQLMSLKTDVLLDYLTGGFYKIRIAKKDNILDDKLKIDREIIDKLISIDPVGKITQSDSGEFEYRGELTWHQLVAKMLRKGFEQDEAFDKVCGSNSYESKLEEVSGTDTPVPTDENGRFVFDMSGAEGDDFEDGDDFDNGINDEDEYARPNYKGRYLFAVYDPKAFVDPFSDDLAVYISPEDFFRKEGHLYDGSGYVNPPGWGELMESVFEYCGTDINKGIQKLIDAGFVWDEDFQNFLEGPNSGPGLSVYKINKQWFTNRGINLI
jgi:hypothetical protein